MQNAAIIRLLWKKYSNENFFFYSRLYLINIKRERKEIQPKYVSLVLIKSFKDDEIYLRIGENVLSEVSYGLYRYKILIS